MTARQALRRIHMLSTIWFIACIGYVLVLVLRQVGFRWWMIFSISGPSALAILLLISLYLFALYRGIGGAQQIELEHPLTTTSQYMAFYVSAPLLGGLAGIPGMAGTTDCSRFLLGVALGTLGTTFAVWIVIDPVLAIVEMLLPTSRNHRARRLAEAEAQRHARHEKREHLLAEAFTREERDRRQWQQKLQMQAERLAVLLACDAKDSARAEQEAVDIGAQAWHLGGIVCMRQLRDMAIDACRGSSNAETRPESTAGTPGSAAKPTDYLSYWWDGIGDWRRPSLG
ncbi:MAG: hypothetical protein MUC88_08670 [Planctomycetes bacterium]|nr:hypothetical protein [Planctomycetota bacterium]